MKWRVLLTVAMVGLISSAAPAQDKQEDWLRMDTLLDAYKGFGSQYGLEEDPWAYAERWFKFINEWNTFSPKFFAAYGKTDDAIAKSFQGVDAPDGLRYGHNAQALGYEVAAVDLDSRKQVIVEFAEDLGEQYFTRINQSLEHSPDKVEFRLKLANQAAVVFNLAEALEPGAYADELAKAEKLIEEHEIANRKAIENAQWPGHNSAFQGPGDPDELAKAALEFLKANPNWTKPEYKDDHIPYVAAVRGKGWEVEKMIFLTGEPTQYAIDMLVAFKGKKDPEVVYVYQMVFYTAESRGVKPGLPFRFANSRQYAKNQMLLKNVPAPK